MKSSTVYAASLCTFARFETIILLSIRFDTGGGGGGGGGEGNYCFPPKFLDPLGLPV